MSVRIRTVTVGQFFATVGQLVTRRGRVLDETRLFPYGFTGAASAAASDLAASRGWTVTP